MLGFHGNAVPKRRKQIIFDDNIHEASSYSEISVVLSSISVALDQNEFYLAKQKKIGISTMSSSNRAFRSDVDGIMKVFGCSRDVAKRTLEVTTQRYARTSLYPTLSRRFNANDRMLRYNRISCDMFMDTYFSQVTSIRGYKCAQMFTTDFNFIHIENMKKRAHLPQALKHMFKSVGNQQQLFQMEPKNKNMVNLFGYVSTLPAL